VLTVVAGQSEGIQLPELVRAMHQPRSNVVRIVNTLALYGLIEKDRGSLGLTAAFHDWAQRGRYSVLRAKYRPVLEAVAARTGELVLLGLHEGNGIVHIDYIDSDHAVRVAPAPVTRHNLRVNAMGKLALSRRPDLAAKIADAALQSELKTIRKTGVAWNREGSVKGMIALSCPGFTNLPTEPMLAVAWPAYRFSETKGKQCIRAIRHACSGMGA